MPPTPAQRGNPGLFVCCKQEPLARTFEGCPEVMRFTPSSWLFHPSSALDGRRAALLVPRAGCLMPFPPRTRSSARCPRSQGSWLPQAPPCRAHQKNQSL